MDLAKNLAQWRDLQPEQLIAEANRRLPPIAVLVLVVLLAFEAAGLSWRLLESPSVQDFVPAAVPVANAGGIADGSLTAGIDLAAVGRLFGDPPEISEAAIDADLILSAPETTLRLTLNALIVVQDLPERGSKVVPEAGLATIASDSGIQETYRTGMDILGAGGAKLATLHSVFTDRVMIERPGGILESLFRPNRETLEQQLPRLNSNIAPRQQATRPAPPSPSTPAEIAEAAGEVASVLGEHMQLASAEEGGQIVGVRVSPRGDGQVFQQLGLEPGDILIEVNGFRLNSASSMARVFQALGESPQASVTIRRNGQDEARVINIGQLQQIADSLR